MIPHQCSPAPSVDGNACNGVPRLCAGGRDSALATVARAPRHPVRGSAGSSRLFTDLWIAPAVSGPRRGRRWALRGALIGPMARFLADVGRADRQSWTGNALLASSATTVLALPARHARCGPRPPPRVRLDSPRRPEKDAPSGLPRGVSSFTLPLGATQQGRHAVMLARVLLFTAASGRGHLFPADFVTICFLACALARAGRPRGHGGGVRRRAHLRAGAHLPIEVAAIVRPGSYRLVDNEQHDG